jgi:NAD(P)-dependent dehydrogenase (short-subunit alcohol dehydrogenase family)
VAYEHSIIDATEKALNNLYGVNIISHYYTLQAFLPNMIKNKKGHVVATASMASFVSPPGLIPYCNTKAAVMSLHEGLQQEMRVMYKAPEIKFSVVHPTYAATPMIQPFQDDIKRAGVYVCLHMVIRRECSD